MNTLDDELNSDGDCSLREAIEAANSDTAVDNCGAGSGADTITVGFGTFQLSMTGSGEDGNQTGDLDIMGDVTITGMGMSGTAINAIGQDRGFDVHSGEVALTSIKVQNGRVTNEDGGNIRNNATLTVTDVRVEDGTADGAGGGIVNGPDGVLTLSNSVVTSAPTGNIGTLGGGLANFGEGSITTSTVSNSSATFSGGGIFNGGQLAVDGTTVSGNSAGAGGGGIVDNGTATITNSTIEDNTASLTDCCGGGGLEIGGSASTTLDGVTVRNNDSLQEAGGIFIFGLAGLTLTNTTVTGNTAAFNGGGIHVDSGGKLSMTGGEVTFNSAPRGGGISSEGPCVPCGQLLPGTASLDGVTVSNNSADQGGGLNLFNGTDVELLNATAVTANSATSTGGGIVNSGSTLSIVSAFVNDNTASNGPGGIDNYGSLSIADTTIIGNSQTTGCCGGGVGNSGTANIHASSIALNTAENGAGIYNTGSLIVTDTQINQNVSTCCGGGLSNEHSGTVTLENVSVFSNTTDENGSGGGIYNFLSGALTLRDSTVEFNQARDGGGIFNGDGGSVTVVRTQITSNSGFMIGGGISNALFGFTPTLTVEDSVISGNSSAQGGGIHSSGTLTVERSTISENSSDGGSAGGLKNVGTATVVNSTISTNNATFNGGGIENSTDGTLALRSVTLSGNSAGVGPGLANDVGAVATIKNTILANSIGGGDCDGTVTSQGHNLIEDPSGCTVAGDLTGNITGLDPVLGPLDDNGGPTKTHALLFGSPAIDAGSPSCPPPATDQRDVGRPQGTGCDIGAFESSSADVSITKTDPPGRAPTGRDLTYTLTVVNNGPDDATDVRVTDSLPPTMTLQSIDSPGVCLVDVGANITCYLDTIGSGATVTIEIVVKPTQAGVFTNTASVVTSTPDPNGANNSDSENTTVCRITSRRSSIPCP